MSLYAPYPVWYLVSDAFPLPRPRPMCHLRNLPRHQGALTALIAVLPLQFIAYELSLAKGINPDTPRNLAKAVTTD